MRFILFILISLLIGCAQINDLTGGEEDIFAPTIDSARTFPINGQTNFSGDKVHIKFNEYIYLNKPSENIIITPSPSVQPEITSHNKTLEIVFNEPLSENTTYTISFNRAVTDITEKNDSVFQYVFSTGNYIDSFQLSGKIIDSYTNIGVENYLVALYPVMDDVSFDSIPYKQKPLYITQTDKSGNYELNYLKYGLYYLFAIDDKNKDLKLSFNESIAFLEDTPILINQPTNTQNLKASKEVDGNCKLLKTEFSSPGKLTFTFNTEPDTFSIQSNITLLKDESTSSDSLVFWLTENPQPKMSFITYFNGEVDTIRPIYKTSESSKKLSLTTNLKEGKLLPGEELILTFNQPIDTTLLTLKSFNLFSQTDSSVVPFEFQTQNINSIKIIPTEKVNSYLIIDSAAITSFYGNVLNKQNVKISFHESSYFGSIKVISDTLFTENTIVNLLDKDGKIIQSSPFKSTIEFDSLVPGNYQLQLILDSNQDGKWTAGSLHEKRQPEDVIYYQGQIAVKSKWEKEIEWNFKKTN